MGLEVFLFLLFFFFGDDCVELVLFFSFNVCSNSPVKPSGPGVLFVNLAFGYCSPPTANAMGKSPADLPYLPW